MAIICNHWSPMAGRSNNLESYGQKWIQLFGIPVHLRSSEVFRKLGDLCGGFIDCQDTRFSAVRVKVAAGSSIPSEVPFGLSWRIVAYSCYSRVVFLHSG
ncbi:hypothetical protein LINPERPRIM_LOCUS39266 [Linum perenne]